MFGGVFGELDDGFFADACCACRVDVRRMGFGVICEGGCKRDLPPVTRKTFPLRSGMSLSGLYLKGILNYL